MLYHFKPTTPTIFVDVRLIQCAALRCNDRTHVGTQGSSDSRKHRRGRHNTQMQFAQRLPNARETKRRDVPDERGRRRRDPRKKWKGRPSFVRTAVSVAVVIVATTPTAAGDVTRRPVEAAASALHVHDEDASAAESFVGRCNDGFGSDESCGVLRERRRHFDGDDAPPATVSAVPDECRLVMAPSALHHGGWGVFSMVPRKKGALAFERVLALSSSSSCSLSSCSHSNNRPNDRPTDRPIILHPGDILIHITDPNPHQAHTMRRFVWDYLWDGTQTYGHYEGRYVLSAMPGLGMAANGMLFRGANLRLGGTDGRDDDDDDDETGDDFVVRGMKADDAGLKRGEEPGAGAVSHYHDVSWRFRRDVDTGEELFVEYGKGWFRERGFDVTEDERPAEAPRTRKTVRELKNEGYCLDNLVPGPSVLRGAGRGAFASRDIPQGQIIAPVPVIPLSSLGLDMMRIREDGSVVASSQLLKNYCFGHPDSSLLFFPYSHAVHFINHHSTAANAELRWWNGSVAYFNRTFSELQQSPSVQLMLELVATRPIEEGEEVYLDYGPDWAEAWKNHVRDWHRRKEQGSIEQHSLTSEEMNNDDAFHVIRTLEEQQIQPYPKDVFTSCYYRHSEQMLLPNERKHPNAKAVTAWKNTPGLKSSQNLRPCLVVGREPSSGHDAQSAYFYTVRIMNRPGLKDTERIPQGYEFIVTNVPRHALLYSDKTYSSDQHLESAFRKEMSLGDLFPAQWKDRLG
ncbi:hypothetical protein ACHAW6_007166 [Cyclotella cf. meneghiniana]